MKTYPILLILVYASLPVHAETIDLRCEELAGKIIERLSDEGLLAKSGTDQQRARTISYELCSNTQQSAQQQHEDSLKQVLKNFIFESTGGKAGNKRLKRLKP
ncbi:MAG: hypothetical protein BMS9Abin15_0236 [Gammaproteobacteria bacterium]|nr:MAG: hypothetical protein BMS9Abin15_0236 [Gammaproteobacteria bacterium]